MSADIFRSYSVGLGGTDLGSGIPKPSFAIAVEGFSNGEANGEIKGRSRLLEKDGTRGARG